MSYTAQLQPVLDRIDADFDGSLERLFTLLRIKSISADPAFVGGCKDAANNPAKEPASIVLAAKGRETAAHPPVVGKSNGHGASKPHVLFYGHYDVQPVDPLELWETPPFEPRLATTPDGRKCIVARRRVDHQRQ